MVNTIQIQHPLKANPAAATWWILHCLIKSIFAIAIILCLAASTPWTPEHAEQAIFFLACAIALAIAQGILGRLASLQTTFHTPGYLSKFTINEHVKHHDLAINEATSVAISLLTLTTFYLANPHNESYSTAAVIIGLAYMILNLITLAKITYALLSLHQISNRQNWWLFVSPLATLILIALLYLAFPVITGVVPDVILALALLALIGTGYIIIGGTQRIFRINY